MSDRVLPGTRADLTSPRTGGTTGAARWRRGVLLHPRRRGREAQPEGDSGREPVAEGPAAGGRDSLYLSLRGGRRSPWQSQAQAGLEIATATSWPRDDDSAGVMSRAGRIRAVFTCIFGLVGGIRERIKRSSSDEGRSANWWTQSHEIREGIFKKCGFVRVSP